MLIAAEVTSRAVRCDPSRMAWRWLPLTSPEPNLVSNSSASHLSGGRYGRSAAGDGLSLIDVCALLVISRSWEKFHEATGSWGVAVIAVLTLMPFVIAWWLTHYCTAWNASNETRCANVRPGPFQRCSVGDHRAQFVTAHDIGAIIAAFLGLLGIWALFML